MQKNPKFIEENLANLCASIQHSIVSILLNKLEEAIKQTGIKELAIAGGVSANSYLRSELKNLAKNKGYQLYIPKFEYCTDNAAMIAIAGYFKYLDKDFADQSETPSARLPF
jgi:N6-L-threonylcarbamoyladenine synthase